MFYASSKILICFIILLTKQKSIPMQKATCTAVIFLLLIFSNSVFAQTYREMMNRPDKYTFKQIREAFYKEWETKEEAEKQKEAMTEEGEEEFEGEYYQFKRWEEFMSTHLDEQGRIFNYNVRNQEEISKEQLAGLKKEEIVSPSWQFIGPRSTSLTNGLHIGIGRVNCIAFHPTDANTLWVGTASGGLWKSTNHGGTWSCITDNISAGLGISGIAVSTGNPDLIYILTGDGDGGNEPSIGVLKTIDGGLTWNTTSLSFKEKDYVRAFKLLMIDENNMFVATNLGLYVTHDGFTTKASKKLKYENTSIYDIEACPTNSKFMYAASNGKFFRSKNYGNKWNEIIPSESGLPGFDPNSRIALAVSVDNPLRVYAAYASDLANYKGIYMSDDRGLNFIQQTTAIVNVMGGPEDGSGTDSQYWYDFTLASPEYDADMVFIGGINLWKSKDNGGNWLISSTGNEDGSGSPSYVHVDQHALEMNPLNKYIYAGNDGGIYYSTDTGKTWIDLSPGLEISQIYRMSDVDQINSSIYFGTQDNGTNQLPLNNTAANTTGGGDGGAVASKNGYVYASNNWGALSRNTSANVTNLLTRVNITPPNESSHMLIYYPFEIDPVTDGAIWAAYDTLYKSIDHGTSWVPMPGTLDLGDINRIAISNSIPQEKFVSTDEFLVRVDGSGGKHDIGAGLPTGIFYTGKKLLLTDICLSTDSAMSDRYAWVSFGGYESGKKVYRTNDGGSNWMPYTSGLPNVPVHCLVNLPGDSAHLLFAGTDIGVYYRDTTMASWLPYKTGMPIVQVTDLKVDTSTNTLYAATFGRGIWKTNFRCSSTHTAAIISGESSICSGESLTLTADGPCGYDSYSWSTGENTKTIEVGSEGTYTVTISNGTDTKTATHNICNHDENNPICIRWQQSLGLSTYVPYGSAQCANGSTVFAGAGSTSLGTNIFTGISKVDASGSIEWQQVHGSSDLSNGIYGVAHSIDTTNDGGFIIAGFTTGDVPNYHDSGIETERTFDYLVTKTDPEGNLQWQKAFGGSGFEIANSVRQTTDGGYIVLGTAASSDGDVLEWHEGYSGDASHSSANPDLWVLKLDPSGNVEWQRCLGGTGPDGGYTPTSVPSCAITQTSDGDYVVTGFVNSTDGDVSPNPTSEGWIVKIDGTGAIVWQTFLTESFLTVLGINAILETNAHDLIITGHGNYVFDNGDFMVAKFNSLGDQIFETELGGSGYDVARDIIETEDGGIVVAGYTNSNDLDVSFNHGGADFWVVKLLANGGMDWQKSFGGSSNDYAYNIKESADGSIVIGGFSTSSDGDVTEVDETYGFPLGWVIDLASGCPRPYKDFGTTDITASSAMIHWGTRSCADGYQINWKALSDVEWSYFNSSGTTGTEELINLVPSTEYVWTVQSHCIDATDDYYSPPSPVQTFTTLDPVKVGDDKDVKFDCLLYPNPTNGNFSLDINSFVSGVAEIEVTTMLGNTIYQDNLQVNEQHNNYVFNNLLQSQGLYFVIIKFNNEKVVRKIVRHN